MIPRLYSLFLNASLTPRNHSGISSAPLLQLQPFLLMACINSDVMVIRRVSIDILGCLDNRAPPTHDAAAKRSFALLHCSTMEASVGNPLRKRNFAGYSRHFWSARFRRDSHNDLVWVNKWYTPEDLRSSAPVQCHKFLSQPRPDLSSIPAHWVPTSEAPLKSFSRAAEEREVYVSNQSSRSEEWSTLRQMLPSKGSCVRQQPPKWGTGTDKPPSWSSKKTRRFPHINSPMTK